MILDHIVVLVLLIPKYGDILVTNDDTQVTDAMVVLIESIPGSTLQVVDFYEEYVSHKLMLVNSHILGHRIILERGVDAPADC